MPGILDDILGEQKPKVGGMLDDILGPPDKSIVAPNVPIPDTGVLPVSSGTEAQTSTLPTRKSIFDVTRPATTVPTEPVDTRTGIAKAVDTVTALPRGIYHGITRALPEMAGKTLEFVGGHLPGAEESTVPKTSPPNYGRGNIDLNARPVVKNPDGSISTVRSIGMNIDGKEVVLPTVSDDGRIMTNDEALQQFRKTGKYLGKFDTIDQANAYAEQLHRDQEQRYSTLPEDKGNAIQRFGKKVSEFNLSPANFGRMTKEDIAVEKKADESRKGIESVMYQIGDMLGPSVIPGAITGTAARVLLGVGKLAKAARAAEVAGDLVSKELYLSKANQLAKLANKVGGIGAAGLFGGQQAQQTVESTNDRIAQLEAKGDHAGAEALRKDWTVKAAPYLTGAIEAVGEYFGTKYLTKLFGLDQVTALKRSKGEFIKDLLKTMGVEVGTEMGQQFGEAGVEKLTGIRPEADVWGETKSVILPTIGLTLLTGGLARGSSKLAEKLTRGEPIAPTPQEQEQIRETINTVKAEHPDVFAGYTDEEIYQSLMQPKGVPSTLVPEKSATLPEILPSEEVYGGLMGEMGAPAPREFKTTLPVHDLNILTGQPTDRGKQVLKDAEANNLLGQLNKFEDQTKADKVMGDVMRQWDAGPLAPPVAGVPVGPKPTPTAPVSPAGAIAAIPQEPGMTLPTAAPVEAQKVAPTPTIPVQNLPEKAAEEIKGVLPPLDLQAHEAATSPLNTLPQPTEAQKEAGNYAKGHLNVQGLDISIENPRGSIRQGKTPEGKSWTTELKSHYGYIRGTIGRDKDHIDTFIGPNPDSQKVYVVDQTDPKTGKFDEHKVMLGFNNQADANFGYHENYDKNWKGAGAITEMSMPEFKSWLASGNTKKALAYQEKVTPVEHRRPENISLRQTIDEYEKRAVNGDMKAIEHLVNAGVWADSLPTGLLNKRAYNKLKPVLDAMPKQFFLDLDNFHATNQSLTHQGGDQVLVFIGKLIKKHLGTDSLAARWGGDEFAGAGGEDLDARLKALQADAENAILPITLEDGKQIEQRGIRLSFGVGKDYTEAYNANDKAKQERKAAGLRYERGGVLPAVPGGIVEKTAEGGEVRPAIPEKQQAKEVTTLPPAAELKRITLPATAMINSITKDEATTRLAKGDRTVLPHIEEGVKELGKATMQDEMVNGALSKAIENGTRKELASIEPDLHKVLRGETLPESVVPHGTYTDKHEFSSGTPVRVGKSPQVYTIMREIEATPTEKALGERYFEVKNDKTGEVATHEIKDLSLIKKAGEKIPTKEEPKKPTVTQSLRSFIEAGNESITKDEIKNLYEVKKGQMTEDQARKSFDRMLAEKKKAAEADINKKGEKEGIVNVPERIVPSAESAAKAKEILDRAPLTKQTITNGTIKTITGREIPAPPEIRTDTPQKAKRDMQRQEMWLKTQAQAEVDSRNDDYNKIWIDGLKPGKFSQADKDFVNEYLFNEANPTFIKEKESAKSVTKKETKKEAKHAEKVRENERRVQEGGPVGPVGEREGGENLQQPAEAGPKAGDREKQVADVKAKLETFPVMQKLIAEFKKTGELANGNFTGWTVNVAGKGNSDLRQEIMSLIAGKKVVKIGANLGNFQKTVSRWIQDNYINEVSAETVTGPSEKAAPAKEPWQMTKDEYANSGNELSEAYHRNGIVVAIRAGKPVPAEVLADYPELQAKETAEKVKEPSEPKAEKKSKPAPKTKITSTDTALRRYWELRSERVTEAASKPATEQLAALQKETSRGDLFDVPLAEDATPGARRLIEDIRSNIKPFTEWAGSIAGGRRGKWSKKPADAIMQALEEKSYHILARAKAYIELVGSLRQELSGLRGVKEIAEKYTEWRRAGDEKASKAYHSEYTGRKVVVPEISENQEGAIYFHSLLRRDSRFTLDDYGIKRDIENENIIDKRQKSVHDRPTHKLEDIHREDLPDYRKGKDVTGDDLKKTFGFASVTFGKYATQAVRQLHVNHFFDSMHDLAKRIGVKPADMSLGGTLHVAIGALGHGRYSATYIHGLPHPETGAKVNAVNLTRDRGDGALSHEWGHAFDYFLRNIPAGNSLMVKIEQHLKKRYDVDYLRNYVKQFLTGSTFYRDIKKETKEGALRWLRQERNNLTNKGTSTEYYRNAGRLDKGKAKNPYWSNPQEMFARAFEAATYDALEGSNPYLVSDFVQEGKTKAPEYKGTPYPAGQERTEINQTIQELLDNLEWSEKGPVVKADAKFTQDTGLDAYVKEIELISKDIDSFDAHIKEQAKAKRESKLTEAEADAMLAKDHAEMEAGSMDRIKQTLLKRADRELAEGKITEEQYKRVLQSANAIQTETVPITTESISAKFDEFTERMSEKYGHAPKYEELSENDKKESDRLVRLKAEQLTKPEVPITTSTLFTGMDDEALNAMIDEQISLEFPQKPQETRETIAEGEKAAEQKTEQRQKENKVPIEDEKTMGAVAQEFKDAGVEGINEALTGLYKIFGGGAVKSFPSGFDEASYAAAKPHFIAAYQASLRAGRSAAEFANLILKAFGAKIKPFLFRFMKDVRDGQISIDNQAESAKLKATEAKNEAEGIGPARGPETRPVVDEQSQVSPGILPGEGVGPVSEQKVGGIPGPEGNRVREPRTGTSEKNVPGPGEGAGERGVHAVEHGPAKPGTAPSRVGRPAETDLGVGAGIALKPNERNNVIADNETVVPATKSQRIKANIDAVKLVKKLFDENRNATPAEKKILQQYTGWGALAQDAFNPEFLRTVDRNNGQAYTYWDAKTTQKFNKWKTEIGNALHPDLGGVLTKEELEAAKGSTLNAHYTERGVIKSVWNAVKRMGFEGGRVLEPAGGVGHFFGLMPQELAENSRLHGVELDKISSMIFQKLYPQANIQNTGFETARGIGHNNFDLVISNFPFGDYPVFDKKHPEYSNWNIHNYFFARALDAAKPGGIVAAITSHYTMDSLNAKTRDYLATKADLVGAIRLPNSAFKENAGTEVVTDIIFLRKKSDTPIADMPSFRYAERMAPTEADAKKLAKLDADKAELMGKLAEPKLPKKEKEKLERQLEEARKLIDTVSAPVNEYFIKHPELVLGTPSMKGTMYGGNQYTVDPIAGADMNALLAKAVSALPEKIMDYENTIHDDISEEVEYDLASREGSMVERNGAVKIVEDGKLVDPSWINAPGMKERAAQYIKVKTTLGELVNRELNPDTENEYIEEARKELNTAYDAFHAKHGFISEKANAYRLSDDGEFPAVAALEDVKRIGVEKKITSGKNKGQIRNLYEEQYSKNDIFKKRVNFPFEEPSKADTVIDAVQISLLYRNAVNTVYISELTGRSEEDVKSEILKEGHAFIDPASGLLVSKEEYLSGQVKKKLRQAEAAVEDDKKYEANVRELKKVIPKDISIDRISFRLGSEWIPSKIIEDFAADEVGINAKIELADSPTGKSWTIDVRNVDHAKNRSTWGGDGFTGQTLLMDSLNLKHPIIKKTEGEPPVTYTDQAATFQAQEKQQKMQEKFQQYVRKNEAPEGYTRKTGGFGKEVEKIYNDRFNGTLAAEWKEPNIEYFPGASREIKLRGGQKTGVYRGVRESTIFAHGVGTGKTYLFISLAMEMNRLKTARKAMIVVQNSTIDHYRQSIKKLYPTAKVLIPNEKQRNAQHRQKLFGQMRTGNYDIIIVPHSFFNMMPNNPVIESQYIQEELGRMEDYLNSLDKEDKQGFTAKQIEKAKKQKEAKLLELSSLRQDKSLYFEDLGLDALLIDEAHNYKRGDFFTKIDNVKGLDRNSSARSFHLMLKTRHIQEKTGGKNVILATGTPISNTIAELWTMIRYTRPDLLTQYGIENFDSFVSAFARTTVETEQTATGDFKQVERLNKYDNGTELLTFWRSAADVVLPEDANIEGRPKIKGGSPQEVVVQRTASVSQAIADIKMALNEWQRLDGKEKRELSWVPVVLYGKARQIAIDPRLADSSAPDDPGSKLNTAIRSVFKVWQDSKDINGTQFVFSDFKQSADGKFSLANEVREKLFKLGVPRNEVAIIDEYKKDIDKERAFEDFRQGKIRVFIGSTSTLGTGTNIQNRAIAAHHIDVPLRPMDFEQRNGRIVRHGNMNPEVEVFVYGVKDTLDSATFQVLLFKQKFINQILRGEIADRSFDDPTDEVQMSFEDAMAAFSGRPELRQKFGLETEIRKLESLRMSHQDEKYMAEQKTRYNTDELSRTEKITLPEAIKTVEKVSGIFPAGKVTSIEINGKEITEDIGKTLNELFHDYEKKVTEGLKDDKRKDQDARQEFEIKANGQIVDVRVYAEFEFKGISGVKIGDIKFLWGMTALDRNMTGHVNTGQGLLTSIASKLGNIKEMPDNIKLHVKQIERDNTTYKGVINTPFQHENRLGEAKTELREVIKILESKKDEDTAGKNIQGRTTLDRILSGTLARRAEKIAAKADRTAKAAAPKAGMPISDLKFERMSKDEIDALGVPKEDRYEWYVGKAYGKDFYGTGRFLLAGKPLSGLKTVQNDKFENVFPKGEDKPIAPVAFNKPDKNTTNIYFSNSLAMNGDYFRLARQTHPKATYATAVVNGQQAILLKENGETVGIIMPREAKITPVVEALINQHNAAAEESPKYSLVSRQPAPAFYSQAEKVIEDKMPNKAMAPVVMSILNKNGVKQDEIKWLGIEDYLKSLGRPATKQEVLDFIKSNQVEIKEVVKGDERKRLDARLSELDAMMQEDRPKNEIKELEEEYNRLSDEYKNKYEKTGLSIGADTKFSQWQTPGGENYREVLLTLPTDKKAISDKYKLKWLGGGRVEVSLKENDSFVGEYPSLPSAEKALMEREGMPSFRSPHWEEPNVLAHVRMNDRTDSEGKKVLFIEEIQSDWMQEGKRKGFGERLNPREFLEKRGHDVSRLSANQVLNEAHALGWNEGSVPPAPFSKSWPLLSMKRMIRYAAENGYDRIAWTTGEMQAERYDLSKQIDKITYQKNYDGTYNVFAYPKEGTHVEKVRLNAQGLEDFIGKDIAAKIINSPAPGILKGLDLKVGGEGMKGFYDQILPAEVNKYVKKWGERVAETYLQGAWADEDAGHYIDREGREKTISAGNLEENIRALWRYFPELEDNKIGSVPLIIHALDLTPAMRESVLTEGQPLFRRGEQYALASSHDDVQKTVIRLTDKIPALKGNVEVVKSESDLPDNLQSEAKSRGFENKVEGVFDPKTGKSYIVSENIFGADRAQEVIRHELVHSGIRNVMGNRVKPMFRQIYGQFKDSAEMQKIVRDYNIDVSNEGKRLTAVDEFIARHGEQYKEQPAIKRLISSVRQFLRDMGFTIEFSDSDIINLAGAALKAEGMGRGEISFAFGGKGAKGFSEAQGKFSDLADRKQRFEIDDSPSKLMFQGDRQHYMLGDVLDHPDLYRAYPDAKYVLTNIRIDPKIENGRGKYEEATPDTKEYFGREPEITIVARSEEEAKDILLHEIQHAIQEKEGFARGGNLQQFGEDTVWGGSRAQTQGTFLTLAMQTIESDMKTAKWGKRWDYKKQEWINNPESKRKDWPFLYKDENGKPVTAMLTEKEANNLLLKFRNQIVEIEKEMPFNKYKRLAGEEEARRVSARADMTAEERMGTPYEKSDLAPGEERIVRKEGGLSESRESDRIKAMTPEKGAGDIPTGKTPIKPEGGFKDVGEGGTIRTDSRASTAQRIAPEFRNLGDLKHEETWIIGLDKSGKIVGKEKIAQGLDDVVEFSEKEFKAASKKAGGDEQYIVHNHPVDEYSEESGLSMDDGMTVAMLQEHAAAPLLGNIIIEKDSWGIVGVPHGKKLSFFADKIEYGKPAFTGKNTLALDENYNPIIESSDAPRSPKEGDQATEPRFSLRPSPAEMVEKMNQGKPKFQTLRTIAADPKAYTEQYRKAFNDKDISELERLWNLPFQLSQQHPELGRVMDVEENRQENRHEITNDLTSATLKKNEGQKNEFLSLSRESKSKVAKYIIQSDKENRAMKNDEMADLTADEKSAYWSWKKAMHKALETRMEFLDRMNLLPYEQKPWFDALKTLVNIKHAAAADVKEDQMTEAESDVEKARYFENAKDKLPETEQASFEKAYHRVMSGKTRIAELRKEIGEIKFYMPRQREGEYVVSVYKPADQPKKWDAKRSGPWHGEKVWEERATTKAEAVSNLIRLQAENPGLKVVDSIDKRTPEEIYQSVNDVAIEKFVEKALEGAKGISEEDAHALRDSMLESATNEFRERGWEKHGIHRGPRWIGGYQTEKLDNIFVSYMTGLAGSLTKMEAAYHFAKTLEGIDMTAKPTLYSYAQQLVKDLTRNQTKLDRISGKVKNVAFTWYITGKLSMAAIQLTQNYVTGIPHLARYTKGAAMRYNRAMLDVALSRANDEEKAALAEFHDKGLDHAKFMDDIMGRNEANLTGILAQASRLLALPFTYAETFNRRSAFLAAYRVFRDPKTTGVDQDAFKRAKDFVSLTHYMMNKANKPEWARGESGGHAIANVMYTFTSFPHNFALGIVDAFKRGGNKEGMMVLGRTLAWLVVFGGIGAIPFLDDLLDELEKLTGYPFRAKMKRSLKSAGGEYLEKFGMQGIPALLGVDLSGSIKMGIPFKEGLSQTAYGVYGGMLTKATKGFNSIMRGDYARGVENLSPLFLENPLKAIRMATAGATTPTGKVMFDERGKPIKLTGEEAAAQFIGLRPARTADISQEKRVEKNVEVYFKDERDHITQEFRRAKAEKNQKAIQDIMKEIRLYNQKAREFRGAVPMITSETLKRALTQKPDKKMLMFEKAMQK